MKPPVAPIRKTPSAEMKGGGGFFYETSRQKNFESGVFFLHLQQYAFTG
jgi:hypothetical protein